MKSLIYSEWVEYKNNSEKIEAKSYLLLWKKFFIRKIPTYLELKEETWLEFPEICIDCYPTLALKLELKKKYIEVSDGRAIQDCDEGEQIRSA